MSSTDERATDEALAGIAAGKAEFLSQISLPSLATELLALRKRVGELEGALRPFARIADMEERAESFSSVMVNVDHCRVARSLLPTPELK